MEKLRLFAEKKVKKLARLISQEEEVTLTLTLTNPATSANKKATIAVNGQRAEYTSNAFEESIDCCVNVIQRQLCEKKASSKAL